MRSPLERQLTSRAFALALEPRFDVHAASKELVMGASGNRRALELVFDRVHAVADPRGRVTARVLATLHAALDAMAPFGPTTALAGPRPSLPTAIRTP